MELIKTLVDGGWYGDLASVLGFALSLWLLQRTGKVAKAVTKASHDTKEAMSRLDKTLDISSAIDMMDEIQRLHRAEAWHIVIDRYEAVRKILLSIHHAPTMPEQLKTPLLNAATQLSTCARVVDRFLDSEGEKPRLSQLNRIVSQQRERIIEVRESLKDQIGG